MEEIQALQNAADSVKLPGLQVHAKIFEDKRKSNKYFLQYGNGKRLAVRCGLDSINFQLNTKVYE